MSEVVLEKSRTLVAVDNREYALPIVRATNSNEDQPDERIIYVPGIGEIGKSLVSIVGHISEITGRDVDAYTARLPKILKKPWEQSGSVPGELFEQVIKQLAPDRELDVVGASLAGLTMGSVFDRDNSGIRSATLISPVMVSPRNTASPKLLEYADAHSLPEQLANLRELEADWFLRTLGYAARFMIQGSSAELRAVIHNRELLSYPKTIARNAMDIGPGAHRAIAAFGVIGNGTILPQLDKANKAGVDLNFVIGMKDKPHPFNDFWNALTSISLEDKIWRIGDKGADHHTPMNTIGGIEQLNRGIEELKA